jgi:hypothetical protein
MMHQRIGLYVFPTGEEGEHMAFARDSDFGSHQSAVVAAWVGDFDDGRP